MGTLIEQINELIGVLEIVDPEAAAALRGGQTPGRTNITGQTPGRANITGQTPGRANINNQTPGRVKSGKTPGRVNSGGQNSDRVNFAGLQPAISVENTEIADTGIHSGVLPRDSNRNPLQLNIKTDNLIQGIIYSEILGKPVSRRHRYRG